MSIVPVGASLDPLVLTATARETLLHAARAVVRRRASGQVEFGQVGAAVRALSGAIYVGVCIDAPCGVGFCAEHSAIAAMVTAGEAEIAACVAVHDGGAIVAPCGRCREFMALLHDGNRAARILLPDGSDAALEALLPHHWLGGRASLGQPAA